MPDLPSPSRRLPASPWMVTSRRKVHLRTCPVARRVAFPYSWIPDVQKAKDHACLTCLDGMLPTQADLDALTAP